MTTGRPPFKATATWRRKVEEMAAKGMSRVEIAVLIGCSRSTLTKHFADELKRGHARCRKELVACMWAAAKRGRVGAIVWLEQRMSGGAEIAGRSASRRLGKKARAELAALAAGGEGSG